MRTYSPELPNDAVISHGPWTTTLGALRKAGWRIETKYNWYTHVAKLYVRDPITKYIGCGLVPSMGALDDNPLIKLEHLTHERNARIKPPKLALDASDHANHRLDHFSKEDIPYLLQTIVELQRPDRLTHLAKNPLDSAKIDEIALYLQQDNVVYL